MARWRSLCVDFTAMASPCRVLVDGQDEARLRRAVRAAVAEVQRIEAKYSRYRPQSVISRLNAAAGQGPQAVDEETAGLLNFAAQLWQLSDGLFDITSGVLRRAWDFRQARVPTQAALDALLPLVGWGQVDWSPQAARVQLPQAGMELDLGGFGKEYAADRAAAVLQAHGVTHALVNLGGDLYALGPRGLPECAGAPWRVDIQHPRPPASDPHATLAQRALHQGGLATSGDYERFFEHQGQRYCHILHPHTGWPVSHWQSITVLAPTTTSAGALCTIAMLKGADAPEWLNAQQATWLAVRHDGQVLSSAPAAAPGG